MSTKETWRDWVLRITGFTPPHELNRHPHTIDVPLNDDSSATITLPDGRKLGYAQYGSPTGKPILFQHGFPASRIEGAHLHKLGLELGARIIATDRPGFGWSSPHPGRKLLDHPKDIEYLTEHLKLEQYSVMGASGGGPYSLACAYALPRSKLKCVSIICGMGPHDIGMKGANLALWSGWTLGFPYFPRLCRYFFMTQPHGRLDLPDSKRKEMFLQQIAQMSDQDRENFLEPGLVDISLRCGREAFSQGWEPMEAEGHLNCRDFGFRLQDIRKDLPVQLWYGSRDTHVPPPHGYQIAARIGENAKLRMEDETHVSIFVKYKREAMIEVLKCMD